MRKHEDNLIGESPAFLGILDQVSRAAPLDRPVLVIGERGTGKELIAARLHFLSTRWENPFVKMNCAALTPSLIEAELFGHEAGAFTGAGKQRKGRFERADTGTLFLDELASTPQEVQEKILRVIEYSEFERVGGQQPVRTDVRLIAAANEDLPTLVEQARFRADLLDRLAFDVITLPPLRARSEDILPLAEHFARRMTSELHREMFPGFSREAREALQEYPWPGNVRELKNVVERAVYRSEELEEPIDTIVFDPFASPWRPGASQRAGQDGGQGADPAADPGAAPASGGGHDEVPPSASDGPVDLKEAVKDYEIALIEAAMEVSRFNQRKAADYLHLTYHQLRGYLRKYELLDKD